MRVLLADDQVRLRSALRLLLEQQPNFEVVGEVGTASAVPAAAARMSPDLILMDWELPDMKRAGTKQWLITALRTIQPQVYIIALTGNQASRFVTGIDAFVSKAESPDSLLAALQQAQAAYRPNLAA